MRKTKRFFRQSPLPVAIGMMFASIPVAMATGVGSNENGISLGAGVMQYVGDSTRLSVGYDTNFKLTGEILQSIYESDARALVGEGWLGARGAGGLKLGYNVLNDKEHPQVVYKVFGALDQNAEYDRKATVGIGFETQDVFGGLNFSKGLTGKRLINSATSSSSIVSGTATVTTTVESDVYEKAYDFGAGARFGTMFNDIQLRVTGGLDYEWGRQNTNAKQISASLKLEKFFADTPHSLSLQISGSRKDGRFEERHDSPSVQLLYRYSFGQPYRSGPQSHRVAHEAPSEAQRVELADSTPIRPVTQKRIVKHTVSVASDAFFELDRYALSDSAKRELDRIAGRMKESGVNGNILVTGNTCDLGSAKHNLMLSQNRAEAVRAYLLERGVGKPTSLLAEGLGESQPKYPNTNDERYKNRRVDIEFVTYEESTEDVLLSPTTDETRAAAGDKPTVKWHDEEVPQEPAWVRRALRTPQEHKRSVDSYRTVERHSTSSSVDNGTPPTALDDSFFVDQDSTSNQLDVVNNDTDPDGDIVGTDNAWGTGISHGQFSETHGSHIVSYTPSPGYSGTDTYTYRTFDSKGNLSNIATITITVRQTGPAPID